MTSFARIQPRSYAADAWSEFWAAQGTVSRCLARAPDISEPLDAHWRRFAAQVPPSGRVIDLGCGAGAVGRALLSERSTLKVTGVDLADVPASGDKALELVPATAMERLPFADAAFDAATSQFGFEYGCADAAAKELARVLPPGAPFSFLIHHPEGPLVVDMRRHREAIESLCGLRIQAAFFAGNADALNERFAALKSEFANDRIVSDAERGLQAHVRADQLHRLQIWKAVSEALAPELFMLDSLDLCSSDRQINSHIEPLTRWFDVRLPVVVQSRRGDPIAWEVHGTRLP